MEHLFADQNTQHPVMSKLFLFLHILKIINTYLKKTQLKMAICWAWSERQIKNAKFAFYHFVDDVILLHFVTFFTLGVKVIYKDGSCSVDRISCGLVSPVNRQSRSDGYQ